MDITNVEESTDKKKRPRLRNILVVIFIIIPLIVLSLMYMRNKTFKANMNNRLAKMPGALGEYFQNYPTESERDSKIDYLANHFIDIESSAAADKIYIIKKDDEKLYVDLIRKMNSLSTGKTEDIVLKVRNIELRKDLLFSVHEDAKQEEEDKFFSEVSRIESQDILTSVLEVEKRFSNRDFLNILKEVRLERMGDILYYTDDDIRNYILETFEDARRTRIEGIIYEKTNEEKTLIDIARLYETKPIESSIKAIGNTDNFTMEKLGTIYKNLTVSKSAELLSNIKDEEFIEDLFTAIMREEELTKSDTNITSDISQSMEFIIEYNSKIDDLVTVYEKMSPEKVARIVENMMENTETITSFELNAEEVYELSDSVIIIDVLSKMKNRTLSKVFDLMEADKASKITQLLAKPKEKQLRESVEGEIEEE